MLRTVVVDDSEDVRTLWCDALERSDGFEICGVAVDGVSAVGMVQRLQPDVVVLDLSMPRMSGWEALPLIRQVCPRARVVVVSGASRREFAQRARALGACGYLEKHLPMQAFAAQLLQLVTAGAPAGESVDTAPDPMVLVVESDPANRALLEYLISWQPYRTHLVADAAQAADALRTVEPDVVLTGIGRKVAVGLHPWRGLRRACAAAGIPMVSQVAGLLGPVDPETLPVGLAAVLAHPTCSQDLAEVLARWTQPSRPVEPASAHEPPDSVRRAVLALILERGHDQARHVWAEFERDTLALCVAAERAVGDGQVGELAHLVECLQSSAAATGIPDLVEMSEQLGHCSLSMRAGTCDARPGAVQDLLQTVAPIADWVLEHRPAPTAPGGVPAQRLGRGREAHAPGGEACREREGRRGPRRWFGR